MKELFKSILSKLNIENEMLEKAIELFVSVNVELQTVVCLIGLIVVGSKASAKSTKTEEFTAITLGNKNGIFYAKINTAPRYYRTVRDTYNVLNTKGTFVEYDSKVALSGLWAFNNEADCKEFYEKCKVAYAEYIANKGKTEKTVDQTVVDMKSKLNG